MSTVPPNDKRPYEPAEGDSNDPEAISRDELEPATYTEREPELEPAAYSQPEPELEPAAYSQPEPELDPAPVATPEPELAAEPEPLVEPEPYVPTPPPAVIIPPAVVLPAGTLATAESTPTAESSETAHATTVAEAEAIAAEEAQHDRSSAETAILSPEVIVAPVAVAPAQQGAPEPVAPQPEVDRPATVTADAPAERPRRKGNRGVGVLLAFLGAVVFAVLYAAITALVYTLAGRGFDVLEYATSSAFIVPTATFLVVFVLAALFINRAGWWAWVIGSLVIAVVTYFASSGIILLLADIMTLTPSQAQELWMGLLFSAPLIIALVVAREVSLWFGALIAARGRTVRARNAEARAAYDREREESTDTAAI
ncbi:hypothetical protein [Homoserinimonas hongtaonis]|uniref:Uncharacterized protein n=1 Tax=Homoserinimonas hongtaonis TaxID=2079791 RepID=A0A2U1T0T1_9MICO|nr:hypothetical protein [Salinibacterium hongtaonis]PWB97469.1 hypothetical protein DF220_06210 [Salinibacterium hongtaonis]